MVVPVGKHVQESSYSLYSFLLIPYREVVEESLCPLLEGAVPPLNVIPDAECLLHVVYLDPFEC